MDAGLYIIGGALLIVIFGLFYLWLRSENRNRILIDKIERGKKKR